MTGKSVRVPLAICVASAGFISALAIFLFVFCFVIRDPAGKNLSRLYSSGTAIPVTVTVFGRSNDTLSARLCFYTPAGEIAGIVERSWSGWELNIDCVVVGGPSGFLAFPALAYTDETPRGGGINLFPRYTRGGFPLIYDSPALSARERKSLSFLFRIVLTESWMPRLFGSLHHEVLTIRKYRPGTEYSVFVTKEGTLRLKE